VIDFTGITVVLHEPDAGVVRAGGLEAVGVVFRRLGGEIRISKALLAEREAAPPDRRADSGDRISAGTFCFAPALVPKVFRVSGHLMNLPVGHVCYFAAAERSPVRSQPAQRELSRSNRLARAGADNRGFRVRRPVTRLVPT
jgi:hypothetical protein